MRSRRALLRSAAPPSGLELLAFPSCCRRRQRTFAHRSVFLLVLLLGPAGDGPMSLGRSMRPHSTPPTAPPPPEEVPASLASAPAATTSALTALEPALGARGLKRPAISPMMRRSVSVRPALRPRSEAASSLSPLASKEDHNPQSPSPGLRGSAKQSSSGSGPMSVTDAFPARHRLQCVRGVTVQTALYSQLQPGYSQLFIFIL